MWDTRKLLVVGIEAAHLGLPGKAAYPSLVLSPEQNQPVLLDSSAGVLPKPLQADTLVLLSVRDLQVQ